MPPLDCRSNCMAHSCERVNEFRIQTTKKRATSLECSSHLLTQTPFGAARRQHTTLVGGLVQNKLGMSITWDEGEYSYSIQEQEVTVTDLCAASLQALVEDGDSFWFVCRCRSEQMDELLGSFLRGNQPAEQRSSLPSFVICSH
jgi:hypothetical protein